MVINTQKKPEEKFQNQKKAKTILTLARNTQKNTKEKCQKPPVARNAQKNPKENNQKQIKIDHSQRVYIAEYHLKFPVI